MSKKAYAESETENVVLIKEMMLSNFHAFKKEKVEKAERVRCEVDRRERSSRREAF
jgi:hypothetical protein